MPGLTADTVVDFKRRIERLAPDSKPRWGRMDARLMMRHLRRALEISMGEVKVADRSIPVLRTLIWGLFFHVFTLWPPSRTRLPEGWLPTPDEAFPAEQELLFQALDRFVRSRPGAGEKGRPHPARADAPALLEPGARHPFQTPLPAVPPALTPVRLPGHSPTPRR